MPEQKIGTREEWQAARDELAKLEAEHAELGQKVTEQRRQLPWVPVEKEYRFDTEDGKKTLAELFDGRSQLLAYNIMFGPDYEVGACPGCSNLGDELDATRVHLNHRDVTLICFSRAPIDRLIAYKERMGWQFPYVSTNGTEFPFDFGLALTPEQAQEIPEIKEMLDNPPSGSRTGRGRSEPSSRTACARTPASSPSRARTGASTTPTRCRRPIRSSRRTTRSCSSERRSLGPRSPAPGARTSTPPPGARPRARAHPPPVPRGRLPSTFFQETKGGARGPPPRPGRPLPPAPRLLGGVVGGFSPRSPPRRRSLAGGRAGPPPPPLPRAGSAPHRRRGPLALWKWASVISHRQLAYRNAPAAGAHLETPAA